MTLQGDAVQKRGGDGPPPLSLAQERLWYIDQVDPGTPLYNIPLAFELLGLLNLSALEQSLVELVRRHEALRTIFRLEGEQPVQIIRELAGMPLPVVDLTHVAASERQAELHKLLAQEANRAFDLAEGPLIRASLIRLGDTDNVLFIMPHHTVFDGWSRRVFLDELAALYDAFSQGQASPLSAPPLQYADFAARQREALTPQEMERQLAYWRGKLGEGPFTLELPTDLACPAERSYHGAIERAHFPAGLAEGVQALARSEGNTPFAVLLAAYKTLLHCLTRQRDIFVACPYANRTREEYKRLIGFLVNTLILRTTFSGGETFRDVLKGVWGDCLDAYSYQDLPFQRLVEAFGAARGSALSPLFQTMFSFEDVREWPELMGDVSFRRVPVEHDAALTDLLLTVELTTDGLQVSMAYSTDIFQAETVAGMLRQYRELLVQVVRNPGVGVEAISLLSEDDRGRLDAWNATDEDYPANACVQELFEAQAAARGQAVAVDARTVPGEGGIQTLTYDELNGRSNRLAHYLRGLGVGPDVLVGLCAQRSAEMLVGLLGILKAGGAYVPLDPQCPAQRLTFMAQDCGLGVLLAQEQTAAIFEGFKGALFRLDRDWPEVAEFPDSNPETVSTPDNLAYVIFTSGSTGIPKGVAMPHRPLVNLVSWQNRHSAAGADARTLQFTPLSFDVSFQEIFSTWCSGGSLVLISDEQRTDPEALVGLINAASVERIFLPFVALQYLAEAAAQEAPATLREIITAGEQLQVNRHVVELFEKLGECTLCNQYGPTESHVVTAHQLTGPPQKWPALPPIGRPIANAGIHILDKRMRPVPIGQQGEVYIGGIALARGYVNRPELTKERFIADPFSEDKAAHLYKTGDLARYRRDGEIDFLGRADNQVKVRGFRVEPGEIESVLADHPAVAQAVVTVWEERPGDQRLVATFMPAEGRTVTATDLRKHLRGGLPDYMVPQHFVEVEAFPTTPSGKVDRRNLPRPFLQAPDDAESFTPPRNETEELLAEIWQDILGLERVGVSDNFFDLGGHSLLAIRAVARIRDRTGGRVTPHDILFNTLEQIAPLCEAGGGDTPSEVAGRRGSLLSRLFGRKAQ